MGQGKGIRPVDQRSAGPAARHLFGAVAVTLVVASSVHFAVLLSLGESHVIRGVFRYR